MSTNQITCRKCGGPHFTIKCGKQVEVKEDKKNTDSVEEVKQEIKKKKYTDFVEEVPKERVYKKTYCVKLSELPDDMTEEELMHMTADWGHIKKLKLIPLSDSMIAFIDFEYEDEADYFVDAIDKTPFEYLVLSAVRV